MEFAPFQKIARLSRDVIVTEKIDGTNAQVCIVEQEGYEDPDALYQKDGLALYAGSSTRWITPKNDNYGFAKWALSNAEELMMLGPGNHYGEWWGHGIQRGYGLNEKRFSLFNVSRWTNDVRPSCCHVVPTLYQGVFTTYYLNDTLNHLRDYGSHAAPGFMKPEGIVIYHAASKTLFKKTIENDEQPKSVLENK